MLMAERPAGDVLAWLRADFLRLVHERMNTPDVRRRIGLYGGDRIPENERNLTDVRNRVSLVAEYEMARVATRLLEEKGLPDLFFSYVVANRFPDLELRDDQGRRGLRVEVKCLASIAEEKSANFDTLKKDIDPHTDFVVVFLWEWKRDGAVVGPGEDRRRGWDRAPEFLRAYCFHAASLAHMRDWYWLNKPPPDLGDGLQGFDLRYGVNCRGGTYNEEEGNYGKLMRMWADDFEPVPANSSFLPQTPNDYLAFQREVIEQGFEQVCHILASEAFPGGRPTKPLKQGGATVGFAVDRTGFVLASLCPRATQKHLLRDGAADRLFILSDKYSWSEWVMNNGKPEERKIGIKPKKKEKRKPKHLKKYLLNHHLCPHPDQTEN